MRFLVGAVMAMALCAGQSWTHSAHASSMQTAAMSRQLVVNGQEVIRLPAAPSRIAIGDDQIADVQMLSSRSGAEVLLVGKRPGTTELQIWLPGGQAPQRWQIAVLSQVDYELAMSGAQPGARLSQLDESTVVLSGNSASLQDHAHSMAAVQASGAGRTVDVSRVEMGGMVQVEVKVVEMSRQVMKDIGLRWDAQSLSGNPWRAASGNFLPSTLGLGLEVVYQSRNFGATLRLLEQNSLARVLAEPTLVAMSGHSASFLSGGEIPVPVSSGLGTVGIEYKPFGIGLTVSPTVLSRDRIVLKVAPEASELDYSNAVVGQDGISVPALRTRRADTTVELGEGESYIISGLVSRQTAAAVNKIPFLGDLPIIGAFFRSVEYNQRESELIIVVTPRLVQPIAKGAAIELPGSRQEKRDDVSNAWGYFLLGRHGNEQMPGFSR